MGDIRFDNANRHCKKHEEHETNHADHMIDINDFESKLYWTYREKYSSIFLSTCIAIGRTNFITKIHSIVYRNGQWYKAC